MDDIAFLAVAQAHQHLHWLPVALRLARQPGVKVDVLSASRAALDFVRRYDRNGLLTLRFLPTPALHRDGLFTPPKRRMTLLLHHRTIGRYSTIVTTEATSTLLKSIPGFHSALVYLMHGAGDRDGGYNNPKLKRFDYILVNGIKDKQRMLDRDLGSEETIAVSGYAKFELVGRPTPLFPDDKPIAFYNPHFDRRSSSWFDNAQAILDAMAIIGDWNFAVAPHVKLDRSARIADGGPNLIIDYGSVRSIDMSYTEAAHVYIGDVSSQVYEFIRRPRPCIFLNLDRIDWRASPHYDHWRMGQVIEDVASLGPALARADALQPQFAELQRKMMARSIDQSPLPASERQARAILDFIRGPAARAATD